MPRNVERDALKEAQRRKMLIEAGFKLFSHYGIEGVKLQDIADEAHVGIATLYRYYQNKVNLVNAISAYVWKNVWEEHYGSLDKVKRSERNAYERVESYLDLIIKLYKDHSEILKFSGYYKTYMNLDNIEKTQNNEHLDAMAPISGIFHTVYESAKVDKSIRTDIDEQVLFTALSITMLGTAERYAQGIVWTGYGDNNYLEELKLLKEMILTWLTTGIDN